jgi:UDP-3-O-[3-hydroxymyristoyl] glucosamine N-acyltransferase
VRFIEGWVRQYIPTQQERQAMTPQQEPEVSNIMEIEHQNPDGSTVMVKVECYYGKEPTARIGKHVTFGKNVKLGIRVRICDFAEIGDNVVIGDYAIIGECAIVENLVELGKSVRLDEFATVRRLAKVGEHTRLRHNSEVGIDGSIGRNCDIGSFVRTPSSDIGTAIPDGVTLEIICTMSLTGQIFRRDRGAAPKYSKYDR